MNLIRFHHLVELSFFNHRNRFKEKLIALFLSENIQLERLDYVFCTDDYLLDLNIKYLQHDTLTDIITFDLSSQANFNKRQKVLSDVPIIGEIYISIDRVKANAIEYGVHPINELHRVMIHGALHLCGYKDKSKEDKKRMRKKEDYYLQFLQR